MTKNFEQRLVMTEDVKESPSLKKPFNKQITSDPKTTKVDSHV